MRGQQRREEERETSVEGVGGPAEPRARAALERRGRRRSSREEEPSWREAWGRQG